MAQVPATSYESTSLGDVAEFTIPFPFLSRAEVFVTVDGAPVAFTWINDGLVQLAGIPELGAIVRRYRSTAAYVPLHQFSQGVPFLPRYVDRDFKQTLYAVQESVNETAGTAAQALAIAEESLVLVQDAFDILGERTQYMDLGPYAAGLEFQTTSQVFSYLGEFYAPGPAITLPYTTTGAGAGEIAHFRPVGDAVLRQDLADDTDPAKGVALVGRAVAKLDANLQVLIPTDYPTLQSAIDDLSTLQCAQGVTITLMIEAGHQLLSGVNCFNGAYNHFVISAQDAEVQVDPAFSGRVVNSAYAWAPTLNCLINANLQAERGYSVLSGFGRVNPGCGVKNVQGEGLWVYHSVCTAHGSIWSGAQTGGGIDGYAMRISRGSIIHAEAADCTGCTAGQNGVVYINRGSVANLQSINISGCTGPKALYVHRCSKVNAHMIIINGFTGTDQTGTVEGAISVGRASEVDAIEATLTAINGKVGTVNEGGTLNLTCLVPVTDAGAKQYIGLDVRNSISRMSFVGEINGFLDSVLCRGTMNFQGVAKNSGRNGLSLTDGANLSAVSAIVTNCANVGVLANYGSRINIRAGSVTGSGVRDLDSSNGSFITATLCSTTGSAGTPLLANTNAAAFNTLSQKGVIFN